MFGLDNLIDMLFDTAMESVSRNERIIKLLKHLKLDPEHPPEDFPGVYRYALVEYGVGKPRPVLEIFRQDKIQELFREALERNSPSILLKNGEAFLDDHPLQTDLQSNNVDVRREFYEFAAVFIEVAKRTRTPAEILAEQKLDSLHQQIGTLQERLSRLPTLEGMRTEMARLAAQDNPALPAGEAFNAEQCKAFALAQQMRGWFETLGFRFESHEVWQDDYFEWIINIPIRRGRYDRILVRGIDGEAGLRDVEELKQAVETHRTDEGWLITARRISRAARDEANKEENDGLGCYTLDELLDQDADFSGYLNWLESEIQKRGIAQKYVPLACLKEEVDPDTKQRIGVSRYDDRDGWIDGYIDLWLDDPAKEHISVLGEFGTGKTWFALHYAWKALQHYREAQKRGLDRPRLPLVIPLRDYAKAVSVESLFSEFFFRKHEIPIPGYSAFEQLNRMGKLLLIFDGFDEMAARVDRQEMINNFWELAKVVVPGAKVILTCRTEHFPDARDGRALLSAELQASTRDLTGETPQFEVLELEKFNDQQIRQVLKYQTQPTTVEQIMSNPQLLDLARRPVLTELILEALPDIEAGKPVDMSRVYLYAVHHKMERDIKAERTFTSMADKLYFMCELSWEMLRTDRMSINYREFPNRIRQLFGPAVEEEKDLDHWHYDMMGQTMLIRNAEGDYTPAHRSLIEFFVAYKFSAELGLLSPDFVELVQDQSQLDIREASENHTWTSYFNRNSDLIEKYPPAISLRSFKCESLENLRSGFGKSVLTKALIDLMKPMFISNEDALFILKETCNKSKKDVGFIGGNIVNLLLAIDETALESKNLSETIITGADFTNASLRDTNLSYSCLRDATFANFFGSILSVAISPNNHFFATASSENGLIRLWVFTIRKELASMQGHVGGAWSVAFSPDNKLIASGSIDQTVRVWNLNTKECIAVLKGHEGWIRAVCFSPDGQILASGSHDRTIRLWSTKTGTLLRELIGHKGEVRSLTFCASGQLLISGGKEPSVRIWNIDDGKCTKVLEGHNGSIEALTLIPEQDLVASAGSDQTIRLWEVSTGKCLRVFSGHSGWIESMAFDAKTRTIASGSQDLTIRLWDIDTGKCRRVLRGHTSSVRALGFSNEQAILVSGSRDQTLRFWNTLNGDTIQVLRGFNNSARTIALSNDDQYLVSGGDDQLLRLWDLAAG